MKKASDDLFRLIKSMSMSEKGYFKKYASRSTIGGKNNYIVLFDAIDGLELYDENILREKLKGETVLKQLPVYKNYLYQQILKVLHIYSYESSIGMEVRELINNVTILNKKGLFEQSRKLLIKAKEISQKYEFDLMTLELLHLEKNLNMMTLSSEENYNSINENYNEEKNILEKIGNISNYLKLSNISLSLVEKLGIIRSAEAEEEFKKLLKDPYLASEENARHFMSKILYNHVYAHYYLSISDLKNSYLHVKKELELLESRPEKIRHNPKDYIITLQNIMYLANELGLDDEVKTAINKLKALREKAGKQFTRSLEVTVFSRTADMELAIMLRNKTFEFAPQLLKETTKILSKYKNEIINSEKLILLYKKAYISFIIGEYDNSIKYLTEIINDPDKNAREDVFTFAKILNLVIHLELGNTDLLEYIIQSTYMYLKKHKKLYKVETLFMNLLKQLLKSYDEKSLKEACGEFRFRLIKITSDQFEKAALVYFDFLCWAESKIEGEKFINVLKKKGKHAQN